MSPTMLLGSLVDVDALTGNFVCDIPNEQFTNPTDFVPLPSLRPDTNKVPLSAIDIWGSGSLQAQGAVFRVLMNLGTQTCSGLT